MPKETIQFLSVVLGQMPKECKFVYLVHTMEHSYLYLLISKEKTNGSIEFGNDFACCQEKFTWMKEQVKYGLRRFGNYIYIYIYVEKDNDFFYLMSTNAIQKNHS